MDRVAAFLSEKTPRRFIAIASFVGLLYLFRHLALLLLFFVTFERSLGLGAKYMAKYTGLTRKKSVLAVLATVLVSVGLLAWLGVGKSIRAYTNVQESVPERITELRENPLVVKMQEHIGGTEKIVEGVKHYAGDAISAASAIGHFFVYVLIGLILALVFLLEKEEMEEFWERVDRRSLIGTIGRWVGHVADSVIVTVQLQLIVASFNTVTTLPVLLALGVPHVPALMALIFVSALVPVIGNVVCGVVLSLLAYQAQGWLGVGIFTALTFVLHKIESYYLSPRVTARHVKIPGFLLIISLLACEHLFGFKGLFLSFPILFVAGRIRHEFLEEDAVVASASSSIVLSDSQDQLPTRQRDVDEEASHTTGFELERAHITLDSVRPPAPAAPTRKSSPPPKAKVDKASKPPPASKAPAEVAMVDDAPKP